MAAMNINEKQFLELIPGKKPVLVDFWAPWCTYCRRITTPYEMLAQQYGEKLYVTKVNIDEEPALATREGIEVIPTLVLYQGGKAIGSVVAPESKAAMESFIENTLKG